MGHLATARITSKPPASRLFDLHFATDVRKQLEYLVALACGLFFLCGCHSIPKGRSSVDEVDIRGENEVTGLEDKIATRPSPKFLWLFRGVLYEYSVYDRFVVQDDLARVEAYYRERGYYEAHARAGRVFRKDEQHVRVEILVEEGKPVLTQKGTIDGIPLDAPRVLLASTAALLSALPVGKPFDQDQFAAAKEQIKSALTKRGYAYAEVESEATVDLVARKVTPVFHVKPGPLCTYGPITITGLGKLPEKVVRRTLNLKPGSSFDSEELIDAQQAALGLNVFASIEIKPKLGKRADGSPEPVVPLQVLTEPSKLKAWQIGGGIEFDALKSDVHALIGWEHHNFLGGLRSFSVMFRPGLILYPLRISNPVAPTELLFEERLKLEFRQPAFLEPRSTAFLAPQFNVFPLLLTPNPDPAQPVIGYAELQHSTGINRQFGRLFGEVSHNIQVDVPLRYLAGNDDRGGARVPGPDPFDRLSTIVLSYPQLRNQLDFRDDRVHPHKGFYLANTLQYAGGPFGGTASDIKIQPEGRVYVPLHKRITWATRASVGFLIPFNYGDAIRSTRKRGDRPATTAEIRDYQVTFFRGFFSGGPSSNRGYAVRGVGPYDQVPFLTPAAAAGAAFGCNAANNSELQKCFTPTGGFTLWELSTELRFQITKALSLATFCDASDVSRQTFDIRLGYLHLSCGPGIRYDTPVGPIRADLGVRIPGMQIPGNLSKYELARERIAETFPLGLPLALAVGIGEAY